MHHSGTPQINGNKPAAEGEPELRSATKHVWNLAASRLHHGILGDLEIPRCRATLFPGIRSSTK